MEVLDPHGQAYALKEALIARGLVVEVYDRRGHYLHPLLWVFSEQTECVEYLYVAPDNDGQLYFWFAITLERICHAGEVSGAADIIVKALKPPTVRVIPVRVV